jgi:CO/xanthine dehydrogenase Mo-binding subunit
VTQTSGFTAAGPYDIDSVHLDSYAVYTNLPPAGALRGFGIPQLVFADESQVDIIARELKIDPLEFRRKNLLHNGPPQATGTVLEGAGTSEVLAELEQLTDLARPVPSWERAGIGETGSLALSPAVANAVEDAIGVRVFETPLTPEKVLRALRAKEGKEWEEV